MCRIFAQIITNEEDPHTSRVWVMVEFGGINCKKKYKSKCKFKGNVKFVMRIVKIAKTVMTDEKN